MFYVFFYISFYLKISANIFEIRREKNIKNKKALKEIETK